ncbi:DUF397 domain-containing protein [Actinomadura atramentaria]|uniref:DUF397 domain-containing protein n=1 Tax=Actinomadura atramentaria TaxID=1990 RepID=UPI0012FAC8DD
MEFTALTWRKSSHSGDNGGDCVELAAATRTGTLFWCPHPPARVRNLHSRRGP